MNVLAGGPARETDSALFRAHLEGLEAQDTGDFDLTIRHEVVPDPGGGRQHSSVRWNQDKIERVAVARQQFMDAVDGRGSADATGTGAFPGHGLFMVDTDVILGPGVLERLWQVDAPVVYGVFWTHAKWGPRKDWYPQVWNKNPYGWTQRCADKLREDGVNEVEVYGGGACTLIRGRGFESCYWPLLESLRDHGSIWSGEDRSYCLGLEARGIRQVAVTGLPVKHLYDVTQQTEPAIERAKEEVGLMAGETA